MRPHAIQVLVGQKNFGKRWSPVCWRQLKMCAGLSRNIGGEKRPGGEMRLLTVQSGKSRDARNPGRMVAARRNIRRPSASPNILSIWQNPRLNKKSSRTHHPAALIFFRLTNQTRHENLDVQSEKHVCNDAEELCLDKEAKQAAWKEDYERLSNVEFRWDPDSLKEIHPMEGTAPKCHLNWWYRPSSWWNVAKLLAGWRGSADPWSNRGYHPLWENPY